MRPRPRPDPAQPRSGRGDRASRSLTVWAWALVAPVVATQALLCLLPPAGSPPRPPPAHGPPPGPCVPSPAGGARTEDGAEENSRTSGLPPFVQGEGQIGFGGSPGLDHPTGRWGFAQAALRVRQSSRPPPALFLALPRLCARQRGVSGSQSSSSPAPERPWGLSSRNPRWARGILPVCSLQTPADVQCWGLSRPRSCLPFP